MPRTPEVEAILPGLLAQIDGCLGTANFEAAYLYGSAVSGDFVEGNSDIDLLVVLAERLTEGAFLQLRRMHGVFELAHPAWLDRIEVQYVDKGSLQTFKTVRYDMAVVSPGEKFHAIDAGADWIQNWFEVRENGQALRGPPPGSVIPHISNDEFVAGIATYVRERLQRVPTMSAMSGTQAYAILTLCRALYSTRRREQISKGAAARWACEHLPEWREVIVWAAGVRTGPKRNQYLNSAETLESTREFVRFVAALVLNAS